MRKAFLPLLLFILIGAVPLLADDRHQSYISYDDGGTVVRTGDDGREIEAHRNLPVYPGDEVVTARRGRAEVRLADGNIIGIDRDTAVRFTSMLDSYDGDDSETVVELRYGKVAVQRTDLGRDHVRLDTSNASYVAQYEAIYSVETDSRGRDRVTVFSGRVELRTPRRTTRLRAGETVSIDGEGPYEVVGDHRTAADDFERWFLNRADRFQKRSTRYVDDRLSYWTDDLDDHGRWVMVSGIGWSWRPYVSVGWRPYHNGYWHHGRRGSLVWVSHDPWGWGTHHYGRWAFDPGFGWVWVPGHAYSPAWVYWWYGPSYVGWAPAGWWDCYRPYYNWAYHPYRNRFNVGYGFYGRIRVREMDLRPWTFVDSGRLVSNRIDRAALTTDAVKHRLGRSGGEFATVSAGPPRFTREEVRDPAAAIRRRGLDGRMTGAETGAPPTDLTPFFRRDDDVSSSVRDRIVRSRGGSTDTPAASTPSRTAGAAPPANGGAGTTPARVGGIEGRRAGDPGSGRIDRRGGSSPAEPRTVVGRDRETTPRATVPRTAVPRDRAVRGRDTAPAPADGGPVTRETSPRDSGSAWRGRVGNGNGSDRVAPPSRSSSRSSSPAVAAPPAAERPQNDAWRGRVRAGSASSSTPPSERRATAPSTDRRSSRDSSASSGSGDVPRRVIDRIGGARVYPRDRGGDSRREAPASRSRESSPPSRESSSDAPSTRRNDGGSSGSRETARPSRSASSGSRSSGSGRSSGRVKRDQ